MPDLSKLRICYIAGTLGQGGAERQLFYSVQALRKSGAAVRVLSLEPGGFWEARIRDLEVPVMCAGEGGSRLKRVMRIVNCLKSEPADILQSQHFYTNAYAAVAGFLCRCRGIGALRSNGEFELAQCGHIGGSINLHFPTILAANSHSSIQYAMNRGIESSRLYFLPNAVDTERFTPADAEAGSGDDNAGIVLLAAGRLTREKRFDRFIFLVHRLRALGLEVRGWIAGSGRGGEGLRPELEQQAAALGLLPDALQFLGSVADMRSIYRRSTIFVLTSEHEGTPNVLLEAMASGLPLVATKVGGVPEIVKDGLTGLFMDGEDVEGQVAAVSRLVRDHDLRVRLGREARAHVEANYSVHKLPAHLNGLYAAAFSRSRTGKACATAVSPPTSQTAQVPNQFLQHSIKKREVYEH